ncbi:beta-ketoacyl-[acyl-carrier-protein] synthase family protein [Actimicrobium sp. CCC2.4]|uniref:beta-ketoacyl-[acyl-carrier-protein] synthase family protein n=1 Tax=Actimicrobium sp. CCC2.4 TaxID=3048606 RepID=UPI002AC96B18|nr:beta-ketoacyl-[acyl-carrier-protein] synthase family protein [Actimicrobium sp. CCC2.4]MEB0135993.1 beta-ketoacyl-[acyl-carrier-protein] synthase family protein [Actimicrobium sp. CCC2.4]WPX32656.1 beta-ketoacyl-[acyl-carrier-protein] synthase family protein [Actimicrobium sp. CCC2.4]
MKRVVITGIGAISALGTGADTNFSAAFAGRSGIAPVDISAGPYRITGCAAQIGFALPELIRKAELPLFDRVALLAWAAASEALQQAGMEHDPVAQQASGVFWGTGMGGAQTIDNGYADLFIDQKNRVRPMSVVASMNNASAAQIALRAGFGGSVNTYSSACVSSAQAIGEAFRHIRHGYAERALAGGSEAMLTLGVWRAWEALHVLGTTDAAHPERSCKPFSLDRSGLILGEGGAALMLESLDSAQQRGATILAELAGYGASNDATHMTKPDPAGQARAMRMALREAGLTPDRIDYINAHGAGTLAGDLAETQSIRDVFGAHAATLMVSSTKAVHGHTLGAAGALEFVLAVQALRQQAVPPTAFLAQPDPACDLDYVALQGRAQQSLRAVMSNSFAFGGSNAALIAIPFI